MKLRCETDFSIKHSLILQFLFQKINCCSDAFAGLQKGQGKIKFFQVFVQVSAICAHLQKVEQFCIICWDNDILHGCQFFYRIHRKGAIQMQMQVDQCIVMGRWFWGLLATAGQNTCKKNENDR